MRAAILLVSLFFGCFITHAYSAPQRSSLADERDSDYDTILDDQIRAEETTDHVPWLEEGVKTGEIQDTRSEVEDLVKGELSLDDYDEIQDGKRKALRALKELKRASSKIEEVTKKAAMSLRGKGDDGSVLTSLEEDFDDAETYLRLADKKMRAAMEKAGNKRAGAMAMDKVRTNDEKYEFPKFPSVLRKPWDKRDDETEDDDSEQEMSLRYLEESSSSEEMRRSSSNKKFLEDLEGTRGVLSEATAIGVQSFFDYLVEKMKTEMGTSSQSSPSSDNEPQVSEIIKSVDQSEVIPSSGRRALNSLIEDDDDEDEDEDKSPFTDFFSTMAQVFEYLGKNLNSQTKK